VITHIKSIFLCLFILSLINPAFARTDAVDFNRIKYLLDRSSAYKQDGPNCLATVLYAKGLIDDAAYIDSNFVEAITSTPYCKKLASLSSVSRGDLILIGGKFNEESGKWSHGILSLGEDKVFAKMGFKMDDQTQIVSIFENIKFYLSQDLSKAGQICAQSFKDKTKEAWCRARSAFPTYFRCDLVSARKEIEGSGLSQAWKRVLELRRALYLETLMESKVDHSKVSDELDFLEDFAKQSQEPAHLRQITTRLIQSTRDQIHLIDAFIVY